MDTRVQIPFPAPNPLIYYALGVWFAGDVSIINYT
jgi:hypothetical protein